MAAGRILLVDDDPPLLKLMRTYLTRLGYEVISCSTSEGAWQRWTEDSEGIVLAVVDMTLEGMSGEELARRILSSSSSVRLIVASGYPVDLSELTSVAPGRVTFLQKPFSAEALTSAVGGLLNRGATS